MAVREHHGVMDFGVYVVFVKVTESPLAATGASAAALAILLALWLINGLSIPTGAAAIRRLLSGSFRAEKWAILKAPWTVSASIYGSTCRFFFPNAGLGRPRGWNACCRLW